MKTLLSRKKVLAALVVTMFAAMTLCAQTSIVEPRGFNNPYSPSPNTRGGVKMPPNPDAIPRREVSVSVIPDAFQDSRIIAQDTNPIARAAIAGSLPPTEVYKLGVGDVLFIQLKNAPQGAGYYTVRSDGTIDFPLAGETVVAAGLSVESLEADLINGITLYPDPALEVKIREYGSHKITVKGMVNGSGERSLQREAVPLFVIKAETAVDRTATKALITHAQTSQAVDLLNPASDAILIYPGDSIEFTNDARPAGPEAVYYIAGENVSAGQRPLSAGLTLYQAIVASGASRTNPKKATVRRKNDKGVLAVSEYNVRSIKDGKAADPLLAPGDVIEIRN